MTKISKRNIKDQISHARHIINHDRLGAGVLAQKIKHRVTRLNRAIHTK